MSGQVSKQAKHQTGNPADLPGGQPHGFVKKNKPFYSFPQKTKKHSATIGNLPHLELPCETAIYLSESRLPSSKTIILFLFPSSLFIM